MIAYQWAVKMADRESEGGGADVAQKSGTLGHGCNCCPCMRFWLQTSDAFGHPLFRSCRAYPRQLEDVKQEHMQIADVRVCMGVDSLAS